MVRPIDISSVLASLQQLGQTNKYQADLERERQGKRTSFMGSIGGIGGSIIGGYFGGPMGAAAGGAAGSALGQRAAGGDPDGSQVAQAGYQGYQMGSAQEQRQQQQQQKEQNQSYNSQYAQAINNNPDATDQQKQYANYIKNSPQDFNTTIAQSQALGIDPKTLGQQSANRSSNSATLDRGINALTVKQQSLDENSQEYVDTGLRIEELKSLKEQNLGTLNRENVALRVRERVPVETRVYNDKKTGKVIVEENDPLTGQKKLKSAGDIPSEDEEIYQVPYRDENGEVKIEVYTNKGKAEEAANKHGFGILPKNGSPILEQVKASERARASASSSGKKDVSYKTTKDVLKMENDITEQLTVTSPGGEEIPPSKSEVKRKLRDQLGTMMRTTTGKEKTILQKQYAAVDKEIKEIKAQTTQSFIESIPANNPDIETVTKNIELIKAGGLHQDVDKKQALAALENLRKKYKKQEDALAKQQAQEEKEKEKQRNKNQYGTEGAPGGMLSQLIEKGISF